MDKQKSAVPKDLIVVALFVVVAWLLIQGMSNTNKSANKSNEPKKVQLTPSIVPPPDSVKALFHNLRKKLVGVKDDFSGLITYYHKDLGYYYNDRPITVYLQGYLPYVYVRYTGERWIFMESFEMKVGTSSYQSTKFRRSKVLTDVNSGIVYEVVPFTNEESKDFLSAFEDQTAEAYIRFYGRQFYSDKKVSAKHVKAIAEIAKLFSLANEYQELAAIK